MTEAAHYEAFTVFWRHTSPPSGEGRDLDRTLTFRFIGEVGVF
jgi:hypothetical protein